MIILSKKEVEKELVAVPGKLLYDFYMKIVDGNDILYTPIEDEKTYFTTEIN